MTTIERPQEGAQTGVTKEWVAKNIAANQMRLDEATEAVQQVGSLAAGAHDKPSEIFYVPRSSEHPWAPAVRRLGLAALDLTFAKKDWVDQEASGLHDPHTDSMAVAVNYTRFPDGSVTAAAAGGMHNRFRVAPGMLLPAEQAMQADWGLLSMEDIAELYRRTGHNGTLTNPRTMEIISLGVPESHRGASAAMAMIRASSVFTKGVIDTYIAALDEPIGGMLNKHDDGFKELGLPRISFHTNNPGSNNSTIHACDGAQWRTNMLTEGSPYYDPQQYRRFWTLDGVIEGLDDAPPTDPLSRQYQITVLS